MESEHGLLFRLEIQIGQSAAKLHRAARTQAPEQLLLSFILKQIGNVTLFPQPSAAGDRLIVCTVFLCSQGLLGTEEGAVQRLRTAEKTS